MNDPGLWILISLGSVVLLVIAFIIAPLVIHWWRRDDRVATPGQGGILGYFALVGLACMVVEIALLQHSQHSTLGHPSYSLLVILFVLLLTTSGGAYLSSQFPAPRLGRVMLIAGAALAVIALICAFVFPSIIHAAICAPLPARIAITVVLVTPSSIAMGMMVPSMVRVLSEAGSPLVPWGWGVNGATSVIGTVIATVIAIYAGFTTTFVIGALAYRGAGVLGDPVSKRLGAF